MEAKRDLLYANPLFPIVTRKKLFYYDYGLTHSGTAGAVKNYFFTANGLFDPNVTGTGHQPMGFDQMMLMYEQYTVVASKISATIVNVTGSGSLRCGIYLTPDATNLTDPIQIMENGLITTKVHPYTPVTGLIKDHDLSCDVVKYFGRGKNPRVLLNDTLLYGTVAANPTEQVYYSITSWDAFTAVSYTILFDVLIEYDAYFWEPRKLTVS